jgi:hypothetical protein
MVQYEFEGRGVVALCSEKMCGLVKKKKSPPREAAQVNLRLQLRRLKEYRDYTLMYWSTF